MSCSASMIKSHVNVYPFVIPRKKRATYYLLTPLLSQSGFHFFAKNFSSPLTVIIRIKQTAIVGTDAEQFRVARDAAIVLLDPCGPGDVLSLNGVLQSPPGVGKPIGDLCVGHLGIASQDFLFQLGGVRVVPVSA